MKKVKIKNLKESDFFARKEGAKTVFVRGKYDRAQKKYSAIDWFDTNKEIFLSGETVVVVGFTF